MQAAGNAGQLWLSGSFGDSAKVLSWPEPTDSAFRLLFHRTLFFMAAWQSRMPPILLGLRPRGVYP